MAQDVTAGYIVMDVERLRAPMQKITDYLLRLMSIERSAQIIEFPNQDFIGYKAQD